MSIFRSLRRKFKELSYSNLILRVRKIEEFATIDLPFYKLVGFKKKMEEELSTLRLRVLELEGLSDEDEGEDEMNYVELINKINLLIERELEGLTTEEKE